MNGNRLTELEKYYISHNPPVFGKPIIFKDSEDERKYLTWARKIIYEAAFHEAGHAVAQAFLEGCRSDTKISIIPDRDTAGRVAYVPDIALIGDLSGIPRDAALSILLRGLIFFFSGYAAQSLIAESRDEELEDEDDYEEPGIDIYKAKKIAAIGESLGWDAEKLLDTAKQWADEIFQLKDVWSTVTRVAKILIETGEINCGETLRGLCSDMEPAFCRGKWMKRIVTPSACL